MKYENWCITEFLNEYKKLGIVESIMDVILTEKSIMDIAVAIKRRHFSMDYGPYIINKGFSGNGIIPK